MSSTDLQRLQVRRDRLTAKLPRLRDWAAKVPDCDLVANALRATEIDIDMIDQRILELSQKVAENLDLHS